MQRALSVTDWS